MDSLFFRQRRLLLRCVVAAGFALSSACRSSVNAGIHGKDSEPQTTTLRDFAIRAMRSVDLSPSWFTSAYWDNPAYKPWTDYLVGKISEIQFSKVCAQVSEYCLQDVWNLKKEEILPIDWQHRPPLNWSGIHALSLRFLRTGDALYLRKWLSVVSDFAVNQPKQAHKEGPTPISTGNASALLESAMAWGGIFTAFTVLAKGAGRKGSLAGQATQSPFAAMEESTDAPMLDLFPPQVVVDIARGFATGDAVSLVRYYAASGYVPYLPNQRIYGLEALAYLLAFFPGLPECLKLSPQVHASLKDAFTHYRHRDGGQLEQSFNYAQGIVFAAERLEKLNFTSTVPWKQETRPVIEGWYRMAAALATPQGGMPQVGNTLWGKVGNYINPPRFEATSIAFPYSGYYVQRSSWGKDAGYLFFFYRRAARGHSMAGCNSIQLGAYGRQLLVAGGSANYKRASKNFPGSTAYLAEESSFKVNTIVVDGRSQNGGSLQGLPSGANGKPNSTVVPSEPVQSRWYTSVHFDVIEGLFAEGYRGSLDDPEASLIEGVSHCRQVVFVRSLMLWLVVDIMRTTGNHRYTQVWKFSAPNNGLDIPGFTKGQIALLPQDRIVRTTDPKPDAVNVSLQQFGVAGLTYNSYFGEGHFGYVGSDPLSEPVPAVDVHVEWAGTANQVLITVIAPYRGMASPFKNAVESFASNGLAGCRLEMRDGQRLSILASAMPQRLSEGSMTVASGNLLVSLEEQGQPMRGVILADADSHEFDGGAKTPINAPKGFRWVSGSAGFLRPEYA